MAFSTDSLPTNRAFSARADAALDAAGTGLALLRRWNPKEPATKDLLTAKFQLIKEAALSIDKALNKKDQMTDAEEYPPCAVCGCPVVGGLWGDAVFHLGCIKTPTPEMQAEGCAVCGKGFGPPSVERSVNIALRAVHVDCVPLPKKGKDGP